MNKIGRILFGAALLLCSAGAKAQGLENIIVEDYYTVTANDAAFYNDNVGGTYPLAEGMKCYRIYVDMAPGYKLNQVFGSPVPVGGDVSLNPLSINTTTTFWNDDSFGSELPAQTRRLDEGNAFDSYLTVNTSGTAGGTVGCGSNTQQFGVLRTADTNGNLTMCTTYTGFQAGSNDGNVPGSGPALTYNLGGTMDFAAFQEDGSSFEVVNESWTTLPASQGVDPTGTNRILIAQLTTSGALSFKLNVQLASPGGSLETYVWNQADAGETVSALLVYPQQLSPDCLGVPGGPATIGSACDDGNANTGNDVYNANCVCEGQLIDCLGVPGGTATIGSACDDGNTNTGNDVYSASCVCEGQLIDCLGVPGGTATIGSACDDGNANTSNDVYNASCVCEGSTIPCPDDGDPCTAEIVTGGTCTHPALPDVDGDGTCDLIDGCPTDPNKIAPGICGCGVADVDTDVDGIADCMDSCPTLAGQIGSTCDDGDAQTINDVITEDCTCAGVPVPAEDCQGVPGGTALPGTACNDNDATTTNDTWNNQCVCAGTSIFDCPTLQANIGDDCNDNNANTENDVVNAQCVCAGTPIVVFDCPALQANIGDACNDNDASTINDVVNAQCVCAGTPTNCTENLTLAIKLDAFGSQTTWSLKNSSTQAVVDQGGPYTNGTAGQTITENICVPVGCYHLEVFDAANNGITNGGYVLRNASGARIIDATGNFGGTSEILGLGGVEKSFCLPISGATMLPGLCDLPQRFIQSPVLASNYPGATAYEFWIFDPHGSYNRTLLSAGTQFTPAQLQTLPVPVNVDLDIRVRPIVGGSPLEFGPACRYRFIPNVAHRDERSLLSDGQGVTMGLYPNPTRGGTVYLNMEGLAIDETPVDITIYDALGQQVHAERTVEADGSLNHAMDLGNNLQPGVYVVNVTIDGQRFIERLVMQ